MTLYQLNAWAAIRELHADLLILAPGIAKINCMHAVTTFVGNILQRSDCVCMLPLSLMRIIDANPDSILQ